MPKFLLVLCLWLAWETVLPGVETAPQAPSATRGEGTSPATALPAVPLPILATEHPWTRFPLGSWREIEIATETYDESGALFGQSVTTQQESLKVVAEDSYALEVQATVDVSGKRISGPANTRILRLLTDRPGVIYSSAVLGEEELRVGSQVFPCQVWEVQFSDEGGNRRAQIFHNYQQFPFVLRCEISSETPAPAGTAPAQEVSTLTALEIPYSFDGKMYSCVLQKTNRQHEKGSSQTLAMLCSEIPGGEIASWATDFDSAGRRVRWSVSRLLSFAAQAAKSPLPPPPAAESP